MEKNGFNEILLDVLFQVCGETTSSDNEIIDNMCISAYENACDYLVEQGLLTKENDRIYRVVEKN